MKKCLIILMLFLCSCTPAVKEEFTTEYLGSDANIVTVLNRNMEEVELPRGLEVEISSLKETIDDVEYNKFIYNDETYYVEDAALKEDKNDCVYETILYALRDTVLYKECDDVYIENWITKESELNVIGHSDVKDDGSVDYYKVEVNGTSGYIPSVYADKTYHDDRYDASIYADVTNFGGGSGNSIDYYPKETISFEDNVMPDVVKAFYINGNLSIYVDDYIRLAETCGINAFVVDIKDTWLISYDSPVVKTYCPSAQEGCYSLEEYASAIQKLKDAGYYTIGRITVFKDDAYAKDHKDMALEQNGELYDFNDSYWPSVFDRGVWEYNVALAKEAVEQCGFNEIQFDYVRTPERVPDSVDTKNIYNETSAKAVTEFVRYASYEMHKLHAYLSVDVFGETSNDYVSAYGQYWPAISNACDVISAMPYPDHFASGSYGLSDPWNHPYDLMLNWAQNAYERQEETYDPAKDRTWIQAYDSKKATFDADAFLDEVNGLNDAGFQGGFITWNSSSSIAKYEEYSKIIQ